ncbi:MAG: hypothetical protein J7L66_02725 [Anaerolineaceae bacterium]|nr:hypothetical protein [Anaerolineaceae bacterium]
MGWIVPINRPLGPLLTLPGALAPGFFILKSNPSAPRGHFSQTVRPCLPASSEKMEAFKTDRQVKRKDCRQMLAANPE